MLSTERSSASNASELSEAEIAASKELAGYFERIKTPISSPRRLPTVLRTPSPLTFGNHLQGDGVHDSAPRICQKSKRRRRHKRSTRPTEEGSDVQQRPQIQSEASAALNVAAAASYMQSSGSACAPAAASLRAVAPAFAMPFGSTRLVGAPASASDSSSSSTNLLTPWPFPKLPRDPPPHVLERKPKRRNWFGNWADQPGLAYGTLIRVDCLGRFTYPGLEDAFQEYQANLFYARFQRWCLGAAIVASIGVLGYEIGYAQSESTEGTASIRPHPSVRYPFIAAAALMWFLAVSV